jgi:signal transduction histidine kinase
MTVSDFHNLERHLDALYRVNKFMTAVGDLRQLLTSIMDESKAVADAEASALMLYDAATDELYFEIALGGAGDAIKEIRLKANQGIAGECATTRKPVVVDDCATDPRHFKKADESSKFQTRNIIAIPLIRGDKLIGVLEALNKRNGQAFSADDLKILRFMGDQAAIAIENALLVEANVQNARLAAMGQAVLSISHYIKNILTGMKGSVSLIEMGVKGSNMEMLNSALPIMKRSQAKITSLVQDMLTYSKERQPEYAETNVREMLEEIAQQQAEAARTAGCMLDVEIADDVPGKVLIDQTKIHDGVLNLAVNAVDAVRDSGGGRVTLAARLWSEDPSFFEIVVEDTGTGIPEHIQRKIFDAFFSTKGSKGTGLGLAVTKKVVEEHGGKLELHSTPGEGTTFIVRLPAAPTNID